MRRSDREGFWRFCGVWLLASALGLVVGLLVFVPVGVVAGEVLEAGPDFLFGVVLGLIFGVSFGAAHAWVLGRQLPRRTAWAWASATAVGFVVASIVVFAFLQGSAGNTSLGIKVSHAIVLGGSLGVAQSWVLRGVVPRSVPWVGISVLGWVVAELVTAAAPDLLPPLDLILLFLLGAALPGPGMYWLLSREQDVSGRA